MLTHNFGNDKIFGSSLNIVILSKKSALLIFFVFKSLNGSYIYGVESINYSCYSSIVLLDPDWISLY